jgi:hypothetical protein
MIYSEDILNILCDSIHYPDFNTAWDNLNLFERKEFAQLIEDVLSTVYQDGYDECEAEEHSVYDDGYENGQEDATCFAEDVVIRFVKDLELRDKLLDKLEKGEYES